MLNDANCFTHVYLRVGYTDLRKGIDSLVAIIKNGFHKDPFEPGSIFLFCGRRTDRIKAICHEGDGWLLLYKRLSGEGSFQWPREADDLKEITPQQYRWLMEGLRIEQKKKIQPSRPARL